MKACRFKLTDAQGKAYYWSLKYFPRVMRCGGRLERSTYEPMWILTDHEGYERGIERNWLDTVPRVRQVAEGYGFSTTLS